MSIDEKQSSPWYKIKVPMLKLTVPKFFNIKPKLLFCILDASLTLLTSVPISLSLVTVTSNSAPLCRYGGALPHCLHLKTDLWFVAVATVCRACRCMPHCLSTS